MNAPIVFEETKINILVVENKKIFTELIMELTNQINGLDGDFVLSSNLKQLKMEETTDIVIDLFKFDLNQKKIISKLYNQLKTTAVEEEYYIGLTYLLGEINSYIEKITLTTKHPLTYSQDIDIASIFKLADVKLEISHEPFLEKLISYLNIMQEFCNISLFIFVNLKCYLSKEEVHLLYQHIFYNKLNVLLLENTMQDEKYEQEKYRIIDIDLCEIFIGGD